MSHKQIFFYNWDINGGSHIKYEGNLENTIDSVISLGMNSCQFFLGNPQSFNRSKISNNDLEKTLKLVNHYNISCFTHSPYIHNLCGSKACRCWSGNKQQDEKTSASLNSLEYEMDIIGKCGGLGVVLHPGAFSDRKLGIETIKKSIENIKFKPHYKLLLENSAGQGDSLGVDFKELAGMIPSRVNKNIGICLDTAHIWGYGKYNISKVSEIERMFIEFDKELGLDNLSLVHLNDSMVELGNRKDRHELIGDGYIWKNDLTSFKFLLNFLEKRKIPFVLETEPEDYQKVYQIYKT